VIVLGDIGRSPRMQNHAIEIVNQTKHNVYFVGYHENRAHRSIEDNPRIRIIPISTFLINILRKLPRFLYLIYALFRIIIQIFQISWILIFKMRNLDYLIVQDPPCVPVISTVVIICFLKRTKVIVDFHNYGFTILNMSVKNRCIIWLAKKYEMVFGRRAHYHLCVSNQMKYDLQRNYGIKFLFSFPF
jgi:beta-1,4-mannosyltransferase